MISREGRARLVDGAIGGALVVLAAAVVVWRWQR